MEFFYSENLSTKDNQIQLSQEESQHLRKVLRKKAGDRIQVTNGKGLLADGIILDDKSKTIIHNLQTIKIISLPPERNIHIALSTIRPNRSDWAIEKLTELGVGTISFFHSEYTSVRAFKADHLHKIAISAIKQSRQVYLPQINSPLPFFKWIESFTKEENDQFRILAHLNNSSEHLAEIKFKKQSVIAAIGPEGGFSKEELNIAIKNRFNLVKIDNHILRTETAAVVAAAQLKMLMGI